MAKLVKINSNKKSKRTLDLPLDEKKLKTAKIGYVLSIIGFITALYSLLASLSFLITIIYFIVLFSIIILTLLTILLSDGFKKYLAAGEEMSRITIFLADTAIYIIPISFVLSILAFHLLISKKGYFHRTTGLVFSITSIVICILIMGVRILIPSIIS